MPDENRIDLIRPDAPSLALHGPLAVGVRTVTLEVPAALEGTRALTVELWYPAAVGTPPGTRYDTILRDGRTPVQYTGSARRDAPAAEGVSAPLVILSHGYPGNRFLLSHFGEHLASKGYVVAAIDHFESTYDNQLGFASTLMHRSPDQLFVLDAIADEAADPASFLNAIVDPDRTAIIGYSMGGYGALISAGAGVSEASTQLGFAPAGGNLAALQSALSNGGPASALDSVLFGLSSEISARGITRDALRTIANSAAAVLASETAVDLDEEAANLVRFQQAFQASGRVIQAAADIFDTILAIR